MTTLREEAIKDTTAGIAHSENRIKSLYNLLTLAQMLPEMEIIPYRCFIDGNATGYYILSDHPEETIRELAKVGYVFRRTLSKFDGQVIYEGNAGENAIPLKVKGNADEATCKIIRHVKGKRVVEDVEYEMICPDKEDKSVWTQTAVSS